MASTFFTLTDGSPRAVMGVRRRSDRSVQPLDDAIPDGDTIGTQLDGTGSVRFLGVDAPEKSCELPPPLGGAPALDDAKWEQFLTNPFAPGLPASSLEPRLAQHLQSRVGAGAAANHHRHAVAAGDALRGLVQSDMVAMGQAPDQFGFYIAFSYEVFDRYGRFLAFANRNQPDGNVPSVRHCSYNERILQLWRVLPYFIWPNINPFREFDTITDAVPPPHRKSNRPDRRCEAGEGFRQERESIEPWRFRSGRSATVRGLRDPVSRPGSSTEQGRHRPQQE